MAGGLSGHFAQRVCEGEGLAGGQVVDGDFVSLPVGAGEEDVAADGHGITAAPCRRKRHCCVTGSRVWGRGHHVPGW